MNLSAWHRLVRFGFRLLYHEMAWSYDAVSWVVSLGHWRSWQLAAIPYVTGDHVLELGHGTGHMLPALRGAGYRVVGLDRSAQMGRLARRRVPSVPLLRGEAQQLPCATAVFDSVLATFPTKYVVDPATVAEVYRVLRANGRFVIVPEGHLTGSGPLIRFIEWLYAVTGQRSGPFATNADATGPAAAVWRPFQQRFEQAGFAVRLETAVFPRGQATIIVCQK